MSYLDEKGLTQLWLSIRDNFLAKDASMTLSNPYPIGAIYMSIITESPASVFGGIWERISNRFLFGADDVNYSLGSTGGESETLLTVDNLPEHNHTFNSASENPGDKYASNIPQRRNNSTDQLMDFATSKVGSNKAHNNMPPYLVVNIWKRVA